MWHTDNQVEVKDAGARVEVKRRIRRVYRQNNCVNKAQTSTLDIAIRGGINQHCLYSWAIRHRLLCPVAHLFTVLTAKLAIITRRSLFEKLSNYNCWHLISSINKFRTHFFHTIHTTTSTHLQKFSVSGPCAITQTVDNLSTVDSVVLHACPWYLMLLPSSAGRYATSTRSLYQWMFVCLMAFAFPFVVFLFCFDD